jgi:hypothetical protein
MAKKKDLQQIKTMAMPTKPAANLITYDDLKAKKGSADKSHKMPSNTK